MFQIVNVEAREFLIGWPPSDVIQVPPQALALSYMQCIE